MYPNTNTGIPHGSHGQQRMPMQPNMLPTANSGRNMQFPQQTPPQHMEMPGASPQTHRPTQAKVVPPTVQAPIDQAANVKQLIANLKEVLITLIAAATRNFYANATVDNLEKTKSKDSDVFRFDKSFEQFHALCNQIERSLNLIQHQLYQTVHSNQYTPLNDKTKPNETQSRNEYVATVKQQIQCSKEIYDQLCDSLLKLKKL